MNSEIPDMKRNGFNGNMRDEEVCDMCGHTHRMRHVRERIIRNRQVVAEQIKILEHNNRALTMYLMALIYEHGNSKEMRISGFAGEQIEKAIAEHRLNPGVTTEHSPIDDSLIIKLDWNKIITIPN